MRAVGALLIVILASPAAAHPWSYGLSGYAFFPPDVDGYGAPVARADRGPLHLEARYNYEGLHTGSGFVGWNLETGDEVTLTATPILGLVVGDLDGAAPGIEAEAAWRSLSVYVEAEHVIAFEKEEDSFLYAWIEATASPAAWLRLGLACQRTRAYETSLDLQRGPMIEGSHGPWSLGCYWFNPDRSRDGLFVFAISWSR